MRPPAAHVGLSACIEGKRCLIPVPQSVWVTCRSSTSRIVMTAFARSLAAAWNAPSKSRIRTAFFYGLDRDLQHPRRDFILLKLEAAVPGWTHPRETPTRDSLGSASLIIRAAFFNLGESRKSCDISAGRPSCRPGPAWTGSTW